MSSSTARRWWLWAFGACALVLAVATVLVTVPQFTDPEVAGEVRETITQLTGGGHAHFGVAAVGGALVIALVTSGLLWALARGKRRSSVGQG